MSSYFFFPTPASTPVLTESIPLSLPIDVNIDNSTILAIALSHIKIMRLGSRPAAKLITQRHFADCQASTFPFATSPSPHKRQFWLMGMKATEEPQGDCAQRAHYLLGDRLWRCPLGNQLCCWARAQSPTGSPQILCLPFHLLHQNRTSALETSPHIVWRSPLVVPFGQSARDAGRDLGRLLASRCCGCCLGSHSIK